MRRMAPLIGLIAAALLLPAPAMAQVIPVDCCQKAPGTFVFDAAVHTIAHDDLTGRTYVTGDFTHLNAHGALATPGAAPGIARLDADGAADGAWQPLAFGAPGAVHAVAPSGSVVYAGGDFTRIGGQDRAGLAALDTVRGDATAWAPPALDGDVRTLAVAGGVVYAGGSFTTAAGGGRHDLIGVDTATGQLVGGTDLAPDGAVNALAASADGGTVYVGGSFRALGGTPRAGIAQLDAATGAVTSWTADVGPGAVRALTVAGPRVFALVGGGAVVALDAATGARLDWSPTIPFVIGGQTQPDPFHPAAVGAIATSGSTLYAAGTWAGPYGHFTRSGLFAFDTTTGALTGALADDPPAGLTFANAVHALAAAGTTVLMGGAFGWIGDLGTGPYAQLRAEAGTFTVRNGPAWGTVGAAVVHPRPGEVFWQGQQVTAELACPAPRVVGPHDCAAPRPVDTSRVGTDLAFSTFARFTVPMNGAWAAHDVFPAPVPYRVRRPSQAAIAAALRVSVGRLRARAGRLRGATSARVRILAPGPGRLIVRLTSGGVLLAGGSVAVNGPGPAVVSLVRTRAGARLARARRPVRVRLSVTYAPVRAPAGVRTAARTTLAASFALSAGAAPSR